MKLKYERYAPAWLAAFLDALEQGDALEQPALLQSYNPSAAVRASTFTALAS